MNLREAQEKYKITQSMCVVVETLDNQIVVLSESNLLGGECDGCCCAHYKPEKFKVLKIIDLVGMVVIYVD